MFSDWFEQEYNIDRPKEDYVIKYETWKKDQENAWNAAIEKVIDIFNASKVDNYNGALQFLQQLRRLKTTHDKYYLEARASRGRKKAQEEDKSVGEHLQQLLDKAAEGRMGSKSSPYFETFDENAAILREAYIEPHETMQDQWNVHISCEFITIGSSSEEDRVSLNVTEETCRFNGVIHSIERLKNTGEITEYELDGTACRRELALLIRDVAIFLLSKTEPVHRDVFPERFPDEFIIAPDRHIE